MARFFRFKETKRRMFLETWLHVIVKSMNALPPDIPTLTRTDAPFFIDEWLRLYESSEDQSRVGLAVLAYRVEIHRYAAGMLISRDKATRLAGIKMLGYMRDETAWLVISRIAKSDELDMSLVALKSLFQINEQRAFTEFKDDIANNNNWIPEKLLEIFSEITEPKLRSMALDCANKNRADSSLNGPNLPLPL